MIWNDVVDEVCDGWVMLEGAQRRLARGAEEFMPRTESDRALACGLASVAMEVKRVLDSHRVCIDGLTRGRAV